MRGIYPVQTMRPIGLALRATLTRRFAATLSQRAPEGEGLAPNLFTPPQHAPSLGETKTRQTVGF